MDHETTPLNPFDEHNQLLESNVHPREWQNPKSERPYHLVVIGAGTAGLVTAAGAAGLGARVAIIERELMGGDCLNVGCVPSKAIIRAARVAATVRDAGAYGVHAGEAQVAFSEVMERMRRVRADISPADSASRFSDLGVDVYFGQAEFLDHDTIRMVADNGVESRLGYRKAVIATGARAAAPPIPGLDSVRYLTNETLFSLTQLPQRFGVIGSGPIGCEMAQAFARLGSDVFLFERSDRILSREDSQASSVLQQEFQRDGVRILLNSHDMEIRPGSANGVAVSVTLDGRAETIELNELLVAVGRTPNTDTLNLQAVGVVHDENGIEVNDYLQTSNPRIYAAGDVCSKYNFTHAADFMARNVIQNALFAVGPFGRKKLSDLVVPWTTYTSPEVAHVGLTEEDARESGDEIETYVQQLEDVDRAVLDGQSCGFVKIHARKGTIVGATVVSEHAGDLISEITLAMKNGIGLGDIASTIHPYPTQADAIRKIGDQFNRSKLTPFSQRLLNVLRRINVGN